MFSGADNLTSASLKKGVVSARHDYGSLYTPLCPAILHPGNLFTNDPIPTQIQDLGLSESFPKLHQGCLVKEMMSTFELRSRHTHPISSRLGRGRPRMLNLLHYNSSFNPPPKRNLRQLPVARLSQQHDQCHSLLKTVILFQEPKF